MFLQISLPGFSPFGWYIEAVPGTRGILKAKRPMVNTVFAFSKIRTTWTGTWLLWFSWHCSSKKKSRMLLLDFCILYSSDVIPTLDRLPFLEPVSDCTRRNIESYGSGGSWRIDLTSSIPECYCHRHPSAHLNSHRKTRLSFAGSLAIIVYCSPKTWIKCVLLDSNCFSA